ncbi:MAG: tRNA (adenosine(37)-N6)-threonylcarbamoyltransferase complex dimerization subunit type 1 TsaB [Proteobacteria bacterium]|nr:tRNA (adenosine(37)-N6)-threonylcarbamoyltransferase complex dimerization subunit type 1 TsaB [Pseudomonadota bacterium]
MKILSIDTTVVAGSIALSDGERLVASEQQAVPGTHSERLIGSVDRMLELAGWRKGDPEAIAVAIGPGSFTGLRIGLAAAKGMALSLGIPIVGVSSLKSLALNGAGFAGAVVPLIDAKRGELFAQPWEVESGGTMRPLSKECAASPESVIAGLGKIKGQLLLVGDGALAYSEVLKRGLGARAHVARGAQALAQAANLAMLALPRLARGRSDDLASLAPNYVRRSDAEIGFNAMHRPRSGRKA